ncbi:MAG: SDR family NAD(P)-dependent oxidoreductase [Hyphomicrobium sp.]
MDRIWTWISRALGHRRAATSPVDAVSTDQRGPSAEKQPITVVTGGSRGIGYALAERFASRGHSVALVARSSDALTKAAAELQRSTGRPVLPIVCDITRDDAFDTIAAALSAHGYACDVLINNAGLGLSGPFAGQSSADLDRLIALNITAVTRLTRAFAGEFRARGKGAIITIASLGGVAPGPNQAAYYASKAYVVSLSEAIAVELAPHGVHVAVVCPGPVDTAFHAAMDADHALYRRLLPALTPAEVAAATYRGFKLGQRVIVPGLLNRLLYGAVRVLPHPITVPLIGWLLATHK